MSKIYIFELFRKLNMAKGILKQKWLYKQDEVGSKKIEIQNSKTLVLYIYIYIYI